MLLLMVWAARARMLLSIVSWRDRLRANKPASESVPLIHFELAVAAGRGAGSVVGHKSSLRVTSAGERREGKRERGRPYLLAGADSFHLFPFLPFLPIPFFHSTVCVV